jgi:hypothetical protein
MTTDVPAGTSIYYVPYASQQVPLSNAGGGVFGLTDIGPIGLTLTLNNNPHHIHNTYDIFGETLTATGAPELCTGPAWNTGSTTRTSAIVQVNGVWVNQSEMACSYDNFITHSRDCVALSCTYVGSFYTMATAQTAQQFGPNSAPGGNNNCLCLYNAYNQVPLTSESLDSNASYANANAVWHPMDASLTNRIWVLDGLGQMAISTKLIDALTLNSKIPAIGIDLNSTTNTPTLIAQSMSASQGSYDATLTNPPVMGLWYVQAMESATAGMGSAFFGGPGLQDLSVQIRD